MCSEYYWNSAYGRDNMPLGSEGYRYEEWSFPFPLFVNDLAICLSSARAIRLQCVQRRYRSVATAVCAADSLQRCWKYIILSI
ncbi:uncharacterized protein BDW70DRAFT_41781 [Aspergillus foveolatus]|uniref:uncharacterized protein n=1 Tax=Aspergillus foveolatus TaxID=210207 RepID=UPI003CCD8479